MPMKQADLDLLVEMQQLCSATENDLVELERIHQFLEERGARWKRLGELYQEEWPRLVDSEELDAEQTGLLAGMVPEGRYSILDQDTIWDATSELHGKLVAIMKLLVAQL